MSPLFERRRTPALPPDGALLVNLASAPFLNLRPVQRFTRTMWALAALLVGLNVLLFLQYRHDSTALRARLAETRARIETVSGGVVAMGEELQSLRLGAQNQQVDFLNDRIAERTFPWSLLFDRVASTLPDGVRLVGLTPVFREPGQQAASGAPSERELIDLKIQGVAKSDDDLYALIDAFFASPVFERPRLYQESASRGEVQFTVDVRYRPRPAAEDVE